MRCPLRKSLKRKRNRTAVYRVLREMEDNSCVQGTVFRRTGGGALHCESYTSPDPADPLPSWHGVTSKGMLCRPQCCSKAFQPEAACEN